MVLGSQVSIVGIQTTESRTEVDSEAGVLGWHSAEYLAINESQAMRTAVGRLVLWLVKRKLCCRVKRAGGT